MPTISGLRRRGYTPSSIIKFSEAIGVTNVNNLTDVSILESAIRDDLNSVAPRTMGVINPIKLVIENYPVDKVESIKAPNHPQNEEMGTREIFFSREIYIDDDFKKVMISYIITLKKVLKYFKLLSNVSPGIVKGSPEMMTSGIGWDMGKTELSLEIAKKLAMLGEHLHDLGNMFNMWLIKLKLYFNYRRVSLLYFMC